MRQSLNMHAPLASRRSGLRSFIDFRTGPSSVQFIFLSNFLRSYKFVDFFRSVAGDQEEHSLCLNCETSKQSRRNFSRMSIITIRRLRKKCFGMTRDVGWCFFWELCLNSTGHRLEKTVEAEFRSFEFKVLPHLSFFAPLTKIGRPNEAFCPGFYLSFRFPTSNQPNRVFLQ